MKNSEGQISKPIREMMEGTKYGRVIFTVANFRQKFNTRTAALGNKGRHGFDIYTQAADEDELHVICRGREDLPAMRVDLRPYAEED